MQRSLGLDAKDSCRALEATTSRRSNAIRVRAFDGALLQEFRDGLDLPGDPFGIFLVGGILGDLKSARAFDLSMQLSPWPNLELTVTGPEASHPAPRPECSRRVAVTATDGVMSLDRDLATFWRNRFDIFPESGHQGLAEFSQAMNAVFAGFPFEDVVKGLAPGITLIVDGADLPAGHAPEVGIPSFGIVLESTLDRERLERLECAFQTAIGIINAGAPEEHRQPYLLSQETRDGIRLNSARLMNDPIHGRLGVEYNFEPSFVAKGSRLVFASRPGLAWRLIVGEEDQGDIASIDEIILPLAGVRSFVDRNLEYLVNQTMIEDGLTEPEAAAQIQGILKLIAPLERVQLSRASVGQGARWRLVFEGDE
ncbi:MAG: hypothetical protein KDB53_06005 [Planctomycetes bacterium]|nr:hypothetical protein [Planctomycetota bacterium]